MTSDSARRPACALADRWWQVARRTGFILLGAAVCLVILRSTGLITEPRGPAGPDGTADSSAPPFQPVTTERRSDPTTTSAPTTINPCQRPDGGRRPENGTELRAPRDGEGVLEVDNGTALDAEVKLFVADASKAVVVDVYVRARQRASVAGVPNGSYTVAFAQGTVWDEVATRFSCDRRAEEFDEEITFQVRETATEIVTSHWTVALQPAVDGTATTSRIDANLFDTL